MSLLDGIVQVTKDDSLENLRYDRLTDLESSDQLLKELPTLFTYALSGVRSILR